MSYSRWGSRGSGHWYTYWHVQPNGKKETADNALFDVCEVAMFTAKDLRDDIGSCLAIVAEKDKKADQNLLDELKKYMLEFLVDVADEYNLPFKGLSRNINYMKWISVKKKLPKAKNVLVYFSGLDSIEIVYTRDYFEDSTEDHISTQISHWMPLPEPPKTN